MNWKNGLTRLYIVGWGLWLLVLATRTFFALAVRPDIAIATATFIIFGVMLPAALLWALRWALDGFTNPGRDG